MRAKRECLVSPQGTPVGNFCIINLHQSTQVCWVNCCAIITCWESSGKWITTDSWLTIYAKMRAAYSNGQRWLDQGLYVDLIINQHWFHVRVFPRLPVDLVLGAGQSCQLSWSWPTHLCGLSIRRTAWSEVVPTLPQQWKSIELAPNITLHDIILYANLHW